MNLGQLTTGCRKPEPQENPSKQPNACLENVCIKHIDETRTHANSGVYLLVQVFINENFDHFYLR